MGPINSTKGLNRKKMQVPQVRGNFSFRLKIHQFFLWSPSYQPTTQILELLAFTETNLNFNLSLPIYITHTPPTDFSIFKKLLTNIPANSEKFVYTFITNKKLAIQINTTDRLRNLKRKGTNVN